MPLDETSIFPKLNSPATYNTKNSNQIEDSRSETEIQTKLKMYEDRLATLEEKISNLSKQYAELQQFTYYITEVTTKYQEVLQSTSTKQKKIEEKIFERKIL